MSPDKSSRPHLRELYRSKMTESISRGGERFVVGSRVRTNDQLKRAATVEALPRRIGRGLKEWLGVRFDDSGNYAEWHRDLFELDKHEKCPK